ncbi:patatin-like phospholipase protein [Ceratobasidium sp. AG-Ba]|nr:patatin-like phospholipase protein [Ceratobasidium sp. AG-Ba]
MLGRLRMSVEDAIEAYRTLSKTVFGDTKWWWQEGAFKADNLELAIKDVVNKYCPPKADESDVRMLEVQDINQDPPQCCVFVCAVARTTLDFTPRFRTYPVFDGALDDCFIWEAARATTAATTYFKPISIKQKGGDIEYVDAGVNRRNNPIQELLDEAASYHHFRGRRVAAIISIGTGRKPPKRLPKYELHEVHRYKVAKTLQKIVTDCQESHEVVSKRFRDMPGTYFRFNVTQGVGKVALSEWEAFQTLQTDTTSYAMENDTTVAIDQAVTALSKTSEDHDMVTIERAAGIVTARRVAKHV